jgi:IclR family acetate operon transcriptional repressor
MAEQTEGGSYRMGPRLYELAARVLSRSSLVQVADMLMGELVGETDETAYVAVLAEDKTYATHIHRVDCTQPLRYLVPRGSRFPLYAGAAGKAILAFLPDAPIPDELDRFTDETVIDREALDRDLDLIRKRGYAVTYGERVAGAAGVAAPLFVREAVVGSLTLSVPVARIPEGGLESFGPLVVQYADRIAVAMAVLGRGELSES